MSKQQEVLKLALEALERLKRAFFKSAPDGIEEWESEWVVPAMNAITAIREALAEQPPYRAVKTVHEGKPYYVAAHVNEMPKNEHETTEELQRLRALVRAQQITIEKLEQQLNVPR